MIKEGDYFATPQRSTSNSHNYSSAAIGTSCQSPLPIYPPRDELPDRHVNEKDIETGSTRSKREGEAGGQGVMEGPKLSNGKKNCLLALFCLGVFMDGKSSNLKHSICHA